MVHGTIIHSSLHSLIASTQVSIHLPQEIARLGGGGSACFEGREGGAWGSYHRWIKAMLFVVKWGTWW